MNINSTYLRRTTVETKTRKIAAACFVGGCSFTAIALIFTPMFWQLGLLAGIAVGLFSGYISLEFREVLNAIPKAWKKADKEVKEWSTEPHPLVWNFIAIMFIILPIIIVINRDTRPSFCLENYIILIVYSIFAFYLSIITMLGTSLFVFITAFTKGDYPDNVVDELGFWHCFILGIGITIKFFVWKMWKYLGKGVVRAFCFGKKLGWELFKLIHSKERVLCAIDGTLGGIIVFSYCHSMPLSFFQKTIVVFFGGLVGAMIGIVNYEIVSKRILKIAPLAN